MKSGPYHVRLGHLNEEQQEVQWIDEFDRYTSVNHRYSRTSFYVPVMTPLVLALKQDADYLESNPTSRRPFRVTVNAGSTRFTDCIAQEDVGMHLYGSTISTTGLMGKDLSLIASEENIEIIITDIDGTRELATFEYKHLQCDAVPEHIDLSQINYDRSKEPLVYGNVSTHKVHTSILQRETTAESEGNDDDSNDEEVDELVDSDGDTVISEGGATDRPPMTPQSKKTAPSTSLTPQMKRLGRASTVKTEELELQLSPSKQPSPANLVKKETEQKIIALRTELQMLKDQNRSLGPTLEKKKAKAKVNFERAIARAQEEHDAALRRNTDMIEELESQLQDHAATLSWVKKAIFASAEEVIELSDDSESDHDLDDEDSSPATSKNASPRKNPSADPFV